MLKKLLFITFILSTTNAFGEDTLATSFESELRALETNQLSSAEEEKLMRNVDAVTDVISDEVATGQAGVKREELQEEIPASSNLRSLQKEETKAIKGRRIRSR